MIKAEDLRQPVDSEKSAELDRRIVESALKRAGLGTASSHIGQDGKFPEPAQDYGAQNLQKRLRDERKAGAAEALIFAIESLETNGFEVGIRQIKEYAKKLIEND
jgi:hypothetical protein